VTFDQLEAYINGTSSISDSELAKTFEENKDFLQNFVQSYQTWFVQPLTQIQGNSLEEGLAKFREIGVEFIQAERVEALNTIKDLLVKIANQLSESEDVQTSEVFSVITEVASKPAKSFKEASIKKLEVWFEHITENSLLANIHDQEYTKIITLLGNYFWKLRAQLVLGKKKYTKKDAMTVIRSIPLEIIRDDTPTEELTKLVEVAELEAFAENEDVDATCRGTLNQEEVTQTLIFDLSDKLIASKLSSEKRQLVCLVIEALTASTNFEKIVKGDLIGRL
jgi:hypothetical protein